MCIEKYDITKVSKYGFKDVKDDIIVEIPFTIYINNKEFLTLTTIPQFLKELAYGFLFSEGIIKSLDDIESFSINEKDFTARFYISTEPSFNHRVLGSGCGSGIVFYKESNFFLHRFSDNYTISPSQVIFLMKTFQRKADMFIKTGGVHAASIATSSEIIYFAEDIGRHNAIDKVIGMMLMDKNPLRPYILLTTGRISSEILKKAISTHIPIVISRAAPTSLSVKQARRVGMTLVGFARGERFNIYTGRRRIE